MSNFTYDEWGADVIDSRDVNERVEELEADEYDGTIDRDGADELAKLRALVVAFEGETDEWDDGTPLILDSYFKEYAIELVNECGYFTAPQGDGYTSRNRQQIDWSVWPYRCIDWDQVADELKADYSSIEHDGHTYWVRSV